MSPLRILHVTDRYPPATGGIERHVEALAAAQTAAGHDVAVLAGAVGNRNGNDQPSPAGAAAVERFEGWYRRLGPLVGERDHPYHPPVADPGTVRVLRATIDRHRPHIVHAHSWMAFAAASAMQSTSSRLVVSLHDYGLTCARRTRLQATDDGDRPCAGPGRACLRCAPAQYGHLIGWATVAALRLGRATLDRVDAFVAVSHAVARAAGADGLPLDRIHVVSPFVPPLGPSCGSPTHSGCGRRPSIVPPEGEYLAYAGAVSPHKGIDVLLEAYQRLDAPPPLVLIGPPAADARFDLPPGVSAVGAVDHPTVTAALAGASAVVVPSVWPEPFGLVAVEAMTVGTPVIASNTGGLAEIVAGGAGYAVRPGDPDALAGAITTVVRDDDLRARLVRAGRERARSYDAVSGCERVYTSVLVQPRAVR